MDTTKLTEKFNAFRNNPATVKATEIGKSVLITVAVAITIRVAAFVVVAGTKALIEEINNKVNNSNN